MRRRGKKGYGRRGGTLSSKKQGGKTAGEEVEIVRSPFPPLLPPLVKGRVAAFWQKICFLLFAVPFFLSPVWCGPPLRCPLFISSWLVPPYRESPSQPKN